MMQMGFDVVEAQHGKEVRTLVMQKRSSERLLKPMGDSSHRDCLLQALDYLSVQHSDIRLTFMDLCMPVQVIARNLTEVDSDRDGS